MITILEKNDIKNIYKYIYEDFIADFEKIVEQRTLCRRLDINSKKAKEIKKVDAKEYKRANTREKAIARINAKYDAEIAKVIDAARTSVSDRCSASIDIYEAENSRLTYICAKNILPSDVFENPIMDKLLNNENVVKFTIVKHGIDYPTIEIIPVYSDDTAERIREANAKLADEINKFYAGTNYWGD